MSEFNQALSDSDLAVTPPAREKIADLVSETDGVGAVRIYVAGGGCSGMNYGMTFAEDLDAGDCVLDGDDSFKLVVDPVALAFLHGAEIDYKDDGVNASFVFNNVFQAVGGSGSCGGCSGGQ